LITSICCSHSTYGTAVITLLVISGPCGGKTTGQARLCSFFEHMGWKVCLLLFLLCFCNVLR